jgi:hypothetical protein
MFDSESEKETEQKRSYLLMALGAVGALLLAVLVIFLSQRGARPQQQAAPSQAIPGGQQHKLEGALRPGTSEFDSYKDKVVLEMIEVLASSNLLGMTRFEYRGRLHNRGDRPLTGVELTANVYSLEDKLIAQNTNLPIPRARTEPLKPGESMRVNVVVDTPRNIREGDVREVKAHVSGFKFQ